MMIRKAVNADLSAIKEVFVAAVSNLAVGDYTPSQIAEWLKTAQNDARWQVLLKEQLVLVAEQDGEVAGFSSLKENHYVDFMYVDPKFVRRGVAGRMLDQLMAEATAKREQELLSDVSITARPAFESRGFEVVRENRNERGGEVLVNYRMRCSLS